MALAHRIIPTILCRGRAAFKGERFNAWRSIGLAAEKVRVHAMRGVDEIMLLDIGATPEGRGPDLSLVEELTDAGVFVPLAVGGGIRTVQDVRDLLKAGADSVVIGEAAWITDIVRRAADVVGSQAIVVTCDVVEKIDDVRGPRCTRDAAAGRARWAQEQGAGEILLTPVYREGTMLGYDLELIRSVRDAIRVPLVAHGGCSGYADMAAAIRAGASAVAAGALFQFTDATPLGAAEFLCRDGIEARVPNRPRGWEKAP